MKLRRCGRDKIDGYYWGHSSSGSVRFTIVGAPVGLGEKNGPLETAAGDRKSAIDSAHNSRSLQVIKYCAR